MPDNAAIRDAILAKLSAVLQPVASHENTQSAGLLAPGNIPLQSRPVVKNQDGSISSVRSMGIEDENPNSPNFGRQVLIPTVIPDPSGKWYTDYEGKASRKRYYDTGQHLGIFDTPENSSNYAQKLHEDYMNGMYGPQYVPQGYTPPK